MEKVTLHTLQEMKDRGERISMLTAYDYPTALLEDQSGIEIILVGDSLGMVVHGFQTTLPVTMDMMVMHCQAVRRGVEHAFMIADMPFMSFQASPEDAKRNAARLLAEGGVDAVKLEGGRPMVETVRSLVEIGIAVQGHIGLTPQSVSAFGGMKVQGKTVEAARRLLADARALEQAGAFSIVLEAVPARLAERITSSLRIPTIGIGAGSGCDGQVLVMHDILGLYDRFTPKFVKQYANVAQTMRDAFQAYRDDVRAKTFPAEEHAFSMPNDVWTELLSQLDEVGDTIIPPKRIAIFGIGAMGCLFGARLNAAADVVLIGHWAEQLRALREGPLRLIEPDGRETAIRLRATNDLAEAGAADVALIVTKANGTLAAAYDAARVLAPDGIAITLQNGLGHLEILAQAVGADRAGLGVTMQGASLDGQVGLVRASGGGSTVLGTHPAIADRLSELATVFTRAGFETEVTDDVRGLVWGKVTVNAAINPLTALLRVPNGALLETEHTRRLMRLAAEEVATVAAAQGIKLPFADAAARVEQVARQTASNQSSMLQDVQRQSETEIEAICGAVVRFGRELGVPTPTNQVLYDLVKALEKSYHDPEPL